MSRDGRLKPVVPAFACVLLHGAMVDAAPAPDPPIVGPEHEIEAVTFGPADSVRSAPSFTGSRNGDGYLAVWMDARPNDPRLGGVFSTPPRPQYGVYAARLDKRGVLLDPGGLLLARFIDTPSEVEVAGSWQTYLVVWADGTPGAQSIFGVQIDAATGTVTSPVRLSPQTSDGSPPSVACGNEACVVVWVEGSGTSSRIGGTRWSYGSSTNEPLVFPAVASGSTRVEPRVAMAWKGSASTTTDPVLVVWRETGLSPYGIRAALFGNGGNSAGSEISVASGNVGVGSVDVAASADQGFAVTWSGAQGTQVLAARIDSGGSVLDTTALSMSASGGARPRIVGRTGGYFVAWEETSSATAMARSLASDGTSSTPVAVASGVTDAEPAASGDGVSVLWTEGSGNQENAYAAGLGTTGAFDAPARTLVSSRALVSQRNVAVAAGQGEYLVTYPDDAGPGTRRGRAARISAEGSVRGTPVDVPDVGAVAAGNAQYLLVWRDAAANEIRGARVSAGGELLDARGFSILAEVSASPCLAFDGERYLVVAGKVAARVDGFGKVEPLNGFSLSAWNSTCAVAHGTDGFLFARDDEYVSGASRTTRVLALRLDKNGQPIAPEGFPITPNPWNQSGAAVAWDGTQYLVAFQESNAGRSLLTPRFVRVAPDGTLKDPDGVPLPYPSIQTTSSLSMDTVWDGSSFVVSWRARHPSVPVAYAAYAVRVRPTGEIADGAPIVFDFPAHYEQAMGAPVIASVGSGHTLVGYVREDVELGWTVRAKLRTLIDSAATGATCFTDDDCWSGLCVGSRCAATSDAGVAAANASVVDAGEGASRSPADADGGPRPPVGGRTDGSATATQHDATAAVAAGGGCGCQLGGRSTDPEWTLAAMAAVLARRFRKIARRRRRSVEDTRGPRLGMRGHRCRSNCWRTQRRDIPDPSNEDGQMTFELSVPHGLELTEARARLRALGEYLSNKYGLTITWTGEDEATVSGSYLVVTISGKLRLTPASVTFTGKDPGMLWRGKAKEYLLKKLERYLDPGLALDALPRR